ncbi:hypothetical protein NOCA2300021 [metagenome]|uniref:Uncharacterized protein n=1 Tax=metagenome TaxID=256318 RepID=A0A2P2C1B1_9ZZZZ
MAPRVRGSAQPQVVAFETPTRKLARPTARPTTPTRSRRPGWASWTGGMAAQTSTSTSAASPAATQNRACQLPACTIQAASGSPIAPPTPRVALIDAVAVAAISGGVISRISEMPTGMNPMARPCIARPTSIGASELDSAQITELTSRISELPTSTRRLPNRSASRPATGIEIAAANRVMVMTQAEFAAEVCNSSGSSVWIGMTMVWVRAAESPPKQSTTTARTGLFDVRVGRGTGAPSSKDVKYNSLGWEWHSVSTLAG